MSSLSLCKSAPPPRRHCNAKERECLLADIRVMAVVSSSCLVGGSPKEQNVNQTSPTRTCGIKFGIGRNHNKKNVEIHDYKLKIIDFSWIPSKISFNKSPPETLWCSQPYSWKASLYIAALNISIAIMNNSVGVDTWTLYWDYFTNYLLEKVISPFVATH